MKENQHEITVDPNRPGVMYISPVKLNKVSFKQTPKHFRKLADLQKVETLSTVKKPQQDDNQVTTLLERVVEAFDGLADIDVNASVYTIDAEAYDGAETIRLEVITSPLAVAVSYTPFGFRTIYKTFVGEAAEKLLLDEGLEETLADLYEGAVYAKHLNEALEAWHNIGNEEEGKA